MSYKQGWKRVMIYVCLLVAVCISTTVICLSSAIPIARSAPAAQQFNGKIAFSSERDSLAFDIFLINPDGSSRTRLTDDTSSEPNFFGTFDFSPAWSPDGSKLAFVSNRDGGFMFHIYSMNADGTNITRVSDDTVNHSDPAWSPDGSRIAFTRGGFCITPLSPPGGDVADEDDDDPCKPFIYSMNVDGSNRVNLSEMAGVRPVWSPDGSKIAFTSFDQNFNLDIFIMNADGNNRIQLTNTPANDVVTSWSPDGTRLMFTSNRDAPSSTFTNEIYTMKIDGSDIVRLTNNEIDEQGPVFSPDSTKIAFQRGQGFGENQNAQIFVMNADGSNQTNISNSSSEDFGPPAWQPLSAPLQVPSPAVVQFEAPNFSVSEGTTSLQLNVVRLGDTSETVSVKFVSANGTASDVSDYTRLFGDLHFAPGETSKSVSLLLNEDAFFEGNETFLLKLHDLTGNSVLGNSGSAVVSIMDNDTPPLPPEANPLDNSEFFVRQHYHDFLNREPDPEGLAFWINNIESCGSNAACREARRIDTSAAFFLSIEFQRTGFYVFRLWTGSLQQSPGFTNFLRDTQAISKDLIVGAPDWEEKLNANTQRFTEEFVSRPSFRRFNPETMPAEEYVDLLYLRAGLTAPADERAQAIAAFGSGDTAGRARALRIVTDNATFQERLFTSGFVQEQYFGYLRRDFDFEGFFFWRMKLDSFNGDFRKAEMVKAFLDSSEYRSRFGPP
jgi:Tol biopolymer transport system component